MTRRKNEKPRDSFVVHSLAMRRSPAWRALPDHARRVLDCLEQEHMAHAGTMNGRLACRYVDFESGGVPYKAIALAIRQCVALGFVEITHQGTPSLSQYRNPSRYRLTYVYGRDQAGPNGQTKAQRTDEWKLVGSVEEAEAALAAAAAKRSAQHVRRAKVAPIGRAA